MARISPHAPTWFTALLTTLFLGGCAGQNTGDTGLQEQLALARARAQLEHERVEALEQRLSLLEQRTHVQISDHRAQARIDKLLLQNETLLRAQKMCQDPNWRALPFNAAFDDSDTEQLRQLERRLRAYQLGRQGGLSIEQREAMRVLLKHDRVLDGTDPY